MKQGKVLQSFASRGRGYRIGETIDIPDWSDWVKAKLVELVEPLPTSKRKNTRRKTAQRKTGRKKATTKAVTDGD